MKNVQRLVSMLLVLAMAVGFLPQTAWAEDTVTEAVLPLEEILQTTEAAEVMEVTEAPTTEATDPPEATEAPTTEATDPPETTEAPTTEATDPPETTEALTTEATDPPETTEAPATEATDPPETTEAPATEPVETTAPTEPEELPPVSDDVTNAVSGTCGEGVYWSLELVNQEDEKGILTIYGSGKMDDYAAVSDRPWESYRSQITTVVIDSGITHIGANVFNLTGLRRITLPNTLVSIGDSAFYYCLNLKSIELPDSLKTIGNSAFGESGLFSIILSDNLTSIGSKAFYRCTNLESINLPDTLTSVGSNAFYYCKALKSITIPAGIVKIEEGTFRSSGLENIELPASLTTIGASAFELCHGLNRIDVSGVMYIEKGAFNNCINLWEVKCSNSLVSIGKQAFFACKKLTSINLPNCLVSIGDGAFSDCSILKNITLPKGLTSIGVSAFFNCNLQEIVIPGGVTSIGNYAFQKCAGLTKVVIQEGVKTVGDFAFSGCTSLTSIYIPTTVTSIKDYAFQNCEKIDLVYYQGSEKQWESISIGARENNYLKNAQVCYYAEEDNVGLVDNILLSNLSIICYSNERKNPKEETEKFEICPGVQVSVGETGTQYISDENGQLTISGFANESVTFEKEGYRTRTIPLSALKVDNAVYLQQATDYPAVNALWIGDTDILHRTFQAEYASDETFILRPEVDWGESTMKSLTLYQEGNSLSLTEGSNFVQLAKNFDVTKEIRLLATNAEGNTTTKLLKVENSVNLKLDGFKFDLGGDLKFTLPETCGPILGGMELKIDVSTFVPVEFYIENGKLYGAVGILAGTEETEKGTEIKGFVEDAKSASELLKLKETGDAGKEIVKRVKNYFSKHKEHMPDVEGSFTVEGDFSIMAYVEGYIDGNGEIVLSNSGGVMMFEATHEHHFPFSGLFGIPMFFEIGFDGDIESQMNLYVNEKVKEFTPEMEIKGIIEGSAGLGVGIAKVLSVSGGGQVKLTNLLQLDHGIKYYQLKGALDLYGKAKVAFAKSKKWTHNLAEKTLYEYPKPRSALALAQADETGGRPDLYDISQYTVDDLSYLSYGSPFMGGEASPFALRSFRAPFVSNAYEGADPKTASFSDGTRLAVWVGYNESHSGPDALNLYYSYYNGNWSQPQVVEDDGTSDAYPDLKVINDVAYVAWQDASQSLVGIDDVAAAAAYMDISAAVFDPQTNTFTASTLTTNSALDMQPKLCGSDSTVYVVWHRNGANDWFGQNQANALLFSRCTGGSWSGENTLYSGLNPLVDFDVCCSGGNLCVAYSMDTDGDLNTTQDVEVYENGSRQTENDWLDSGVTYCGGDLYWYSGGKLLLWGSDTMAEGVFIGSDRFQVLDANGVRAMVYAEENGLASILYAAYYDAASDCWGSPIVLYDAGTSIASFSASVTPEGEISVLIQNQEVAEVFDGTDPYGLVTLDWYNAPLGCNIRVDDVRYYNENYVLNKDMPVYITVTNSGELAVQQLLVELLDEESAVVQQWTLDQQLLSGQKAELEVLYRVKEVVQDKTLTFRVTPIGKEETDTTDNTGEMTLGWNDLSVESVRYGRLSGGDIVIHASIVNRGYEAQENITVRLIRDTPGGTEADSCTVEKIEAFSLQNVSFTVEETEDCVYYVCIDHKEADKNYANDSEFVLLDIQSGDDAPWQIDETTGFVLGIPAGTPTETVLAAFRSGDTEVSVTTPDGAPADTVGTGWLLNIGESSYTIAALGDTDGNGLVNIRDLYDILDHADGRTLLTGLPFQAARVCRMQTVTEADVDAAANHILTGSFGN